MNESTVKDIWNPSTGITGLEAGWEGLAASEISGIRAVWGNQQERLKGTNLISNFTERLSREWAIETGILENLYDIDRGVTQTLIEQGFREEVLAHGSTNQPREFVLQLLNDQKQTLEGIFDFVKDARPLSTSYIKELHAMLLRSQASTEGIDTLGRQVEVSLIKGDWKIQPNYPVREGVTYKYCPPEHVASEMDRLVKIHGEHVDEMVPAEVQAAWLHHRFTQIHPFQDGNGRVARAITSFVLVKSGLFPLVVRRTDRTSYLNALEAADNGDLKLLVDLIVRLQRGQFAKSTAMSETVLSEHADVQAALGNLLKAADQRAVEKQKELENVFDIADALQRDLHRRLGLIVSDVNNALQRITYSGAAWVKEGTPDTRHYYRAQIIENANSHLDYFARFAEYRSWVALHMQWERRARLVFTIHGIGYQFTGSLICAPFLEFRDDDEDKETRSTLVPVAEEGFVFFYNETAESVLDRLAPWYERVIQVALKELGQNF